MLLTIETIPHDQQRYRTVGDWEITRRADLVAPAISGIHVRVSELGNPDYEFLVGLHELVEAYLCMKAGITGEEVDRFDVVYEADRQPGNWSEPGDDPAAPYHVQHVFAGVVERLVAVKLGVNWTAYEQTIEAIP